MNTEELRASIEQPESVHHWGQECTITPKLVERVLGDGQRLMYITPIMTRPNYFVIRVDSKWDNEYRDTANEEWLEDICDAIDQEYPDLRRDENTQDPDSLPWFNTVDLGEGLSWGDMDLQATTSAERSEK